MRCAEDTFREKADERMDGRTDGQMSGRTNPCIEIIWKLTYQLQCFAVTRQKELEKWDFAQMKDLLKSFAHVFFSFRWK